MPAEFVSTVGAIYGELTGEYDSAFGLGDAFQIYMGVLMGCMLSPDRAKVLLDSVAAVSVGIIDGEPMLDLAYVEDVRAETDMNVVVTGRGLFVEVQGTAEGAPFDKRELDALLELGLSGCATLRDIQTDTLASGE